MTVSRHLRRSFYQGDCSGEPPRIQYHQPVILNLTNHALAHWPALTLVNIAACFNSRASASKHLPKK